MKPSNRAMLVAFPQGDVVVAVQAIETLTEVGKLVRTLRDAT
jgi:hypothetical protein